MSETNKTAATKTEMTGPAVKSCTGAGNDNVRRTWTVGAVGALEVHTDARDGGTLVGIHTVKVKRIARGTEYGMYGTTALVEVESVDYRSLGRVMLVAARHLRAA